MTPPTLAEVEDAFREHLYLPDPTPLHLVLGSVVANYLDEDPMWLILVAPPSSGKTEFVSALDLFSDGHPFSNSTVAGMATYSNGGGGNGGLLFRFREQEPGRRFGIITIKELGTILGQAARDGGSSSLIDALREVYDGAFCRELGTAGGVEVPWVGKAGLVAATTEVIDDHHETIAAMGDRFVLYRFPPTTRAERFAKCNRLRSRSNPAAAREHLAEVVAAFLAPFVDRSGRASVTDDEAADLMVVADLTTRGRTHLARDRRSGQAIRRPQAEEPTRLFGALCALLEGLRLIGVEHDAAWRHVIDCAFASMPQERCRIMDALVAVPGALSRAQVVEAAAGAGDEAVTWELDCLRAYGLVERWSGEGQAFRYTASADDRDTWATFRPSMMQALPSPGEVLATAVLGRE